MLASRPLLGAAPLRAARASASGDASSPAGPPAATGAAGEAAAAGLPPLRRPPAAPEPSRPAWRDVSRAVSRDLRPASAVVSSAPRMLATASCSSTRRARTLALRAPTMPKMPDLASSTISISSFSRAALKYSHASRMASSRSLPWNSLNPSISTSMGSPGSQAYLPSARVLNFLAIIFCCAMDRMLLTSQ